MAPGTLTEFQPRCGIAFWPANISAVQPAGERPEAFNPCSCLPSHRIANASEPMPLETGSTSVSVIAVARIASTALPPASSMRRPACAASGWEVATTFAASTGLRGHGVGEVPGKTAHLISFHRARDLSEGRSVFYGLGWLPAPSVGQIHGPFRMLFGGRQAAPMIRATAGRAGRPVACVRAPRGKALFARARQTRARRRAAHCAGDRQQRVQSVAAAQPGERRARDRQGAQRDRIFRNVARRRKPCGDAARDPFVWR